MTRLSQLPIPHLINHRSHIEAVADHIKYKIDSPCVILVVFNIVLSCALLS